MTVKIVIKQTVKIKIQNFKFKLWRSIYHVGYVSLTNVIYSEYHVGCYFPTDVTSSSWHESEFWRKFGKIWSHTTSVGSSNRRSMSLKLKLGISREILTLGYHLLLLHFILSLAAFSSEPSLLTFSSLLFTGFVKIRLAPFSASFMFVWCVRIECLVRQPLPLLFTRGY